ncbi:hypothetical protein SSX86_032888 [Deinandra increscens subsp. villosa]|uniref:SWIM-type domain-containing protein n=1 Tax=Deinandra increscens subsp. villosa TaxID=3103831 RepID=A0AAP0GHA6_9ASTR
MVYRLWQVCAPEDEPFDPYECYANEPSIFTFKIFHGGQFIENPGRKYTMGKVDFVDMIDADEFSVHELDLMIQMLGHPKHDLIYYYFKIPSEDLNLGLRPLGNDKDVAELFKYVATNKVISIYTKHGGTLLDKTYFRPNETFSSVVIEEIVDEGPSHVDEEDMEVDDNVQEGNLHNEGLVNENEMDIHSNVQKENLISDGVVNEDELDDPFEGLDEILGNKVEGSVPQTKRSEDVMENVAGEQSSVCEKVMDRLVEQHPNVDDSEYKRMMGTNDVFISKFLFTYEENEHDENGQEGNNNEDGDEGEHNQDGQEGENNQDENEGEANDEGEENHDDNDGEENHDDNDGEDNEEDIEGEDTHQESEGEENEGETNEDDKGDPDFIVDDEKMFEDVEINMEEFRAFVDQEVDENAIHDDEDDADLELELDDFDSARVNEGDCPLSNAIRKENKTKRRENKYKGESTGNFYVGQTIKTKEEITEAVSRLAVDTKRQLVVRYNDKIRIRVVCYGSNPEVLVCNEGQNSKSTMMGESSKDEHKCLNTRTPRLYTVSAIAKEIEQHVEANPTIPLKALKELLEKKNKVNLSIQKVFRAKAMATKKIHGDYTAQYSLLREYCEELLRSNPGSTVKIDVERECNPSSQTRQFRRIYICFAALKAGFKKCGRDLLGLDGYFIKGPYPGQLLTAVGVDSNNGIYPVAYALVEAGTLASWTWFLECLGKDLDLASNSNYTFISDMQKGIIPALKNVFPAAEHRYCLRHIHENMKSKWRGNVFKDLLWKAASQTTIPEFNRCMDLIRTQDDSLYQWLKEIPAKHWSRAHLSERAKCDVLLNNLCEVFNKQLVGGRDKPIITYLEFAREYLMRRIAAVHKMIAKAEGPLTPAATKKFAFSKTKANDYTVIMAGFRKFQVNGPWMEQVAMDLDKRTCSCRKWQLSGMPCSHVIACIWDLGRFDEQADAIPEIWVSKVYWLETWKKVYKNTIEPMNGRNMREPSSCPIALTPPKHHIQVGRPKKKRKKSADELSGPIAKDGKLSRKGSTTTCSKCNKKGHNSRSCKGQASSQQVSLGAPQHEEV